LQSDGVGGEVTLDSEDADFHGAWNLKKRKAKFVKPNGARLRRRPLQKRNRSKTGQYKKRESSRAIAHLSLRAQCRT
jgi:hypothetical protein